MFKLQKQAPLSLGFCFLLCLTGLGYAQSGNCESVRPLLEKRQSLVQQVQELSKGKKGMDPRKACALGRQLSSNGETLIKWLKANKDWCGVPDSFVANIEGDHKNSLGFRNGACGAVAKMEKMEKMKKEGGEEGAFHNPLGGGGLSGQWKVPEGAL